MTCCERHAALSRRAVLGGALGAGVLAGASAAWANEPGHDVEALLLTCMDYRLTGDIRKWMVGRDLGRDYDHIVLAGASLGATTSRYPAWTRTFWNHLDLAVRLHSISRVIVLDHRDCGAYRLILGEDLKDDPVRELKVHSVQLYRLREQIVKRQPDLIVALALMNLDGSVTPIA